VDLDVGLILLLGLIFATGSVAAWRGRSVLWGLLAMPLGPIPVVILLLLPRRPTAT
jgi:hypothetical protein